MTLSATEYMIASAKYHWIAHRTTAGYPMGTDTTPDSISNGAETSAYLKQGGFVSADAGTVTRLEAIWKEGQQIHGKLDMGVDDIESFNYQLAGFDETYRAYCDGTTVDNTTVSEWAVTGMNYGQAVLPRFIGAWCTLGLDISGNTNYVTMIWNNVQLGSQNSGLSQSDGENPNPLDYTVKPTKSSRRFDGRALSTTHAERYFSQVRSQEGWIHIHTFVGDNSTTTATLPYLPVSSDATAAASNSVTVNGTETAVTSINTSTGLVTFASAPAAAAICVIAYPTLFVASS